jgi:hypothetical protein
LRRAGRTHGETVLPAISMRVARAPRNSYLKTQLICDIPEGIGAVTRLAEASSGGSFGSLGVWLARILCLDLGAVRVRFGVAREARHFLHKGGPGVVDLEFHALGVLDESIGHGDAGMGDLG